jgi:hypothetical protein
MAIVSIMRETILRRWIAFAEVRSTCDMRRWQISPGGAQCSERHS